VKPEKRQGDVVAGDTLARGHVDKGETRVSGMEYRLEKDPTLPITAAGAWSWLPKAERLTPEGLMPRWPAPVT
jgi:hypothetical protein